MKNRKSNLIKAFMIVFVLFAVSCSAAATDRADASSAKIVLVGSTPGDAPVKSMLAISPDKPIDFIRWHLTLNETQNNSKTYVLNVTFGEGQPNTSGFKGGGEQKSFEGDYAVTKTRNREIYQLKNERPGTTILMAKLDDNLFHLLTPRHQLMVGNGGWSYTLNRKDAPKNSQADLPVWITSSPVETSGQMIFDGRTPCQNYAGEYNLQVKSGCHKLKWKLTLSRDSKTGDPTTFALQTTFNRPNTTEGKWTIAGRGGGNNPGATVYQLNPDKPSETISLLVGDENVLFFLDKNNRLLTGDENFSFTLNRRRG